MKDEWLIKILVALIIGLVSWSVHREMGRLDTQVEVLHKRINDTLQSKSDKEDVNREFNYVWKEVNRLRK